MSDCDCVRPRIYLYNKIRNHSKRNTRIINSRRARVSRRAGSFFPQFRTPLPRELNLASDIMIHNSGDIYTAYNGTADLYYIIIHTL